jgi:hypothetical protein
VAEGRNVIIWSLTDSGRKYGASTRTMTMPTVERSGNQERRKLQFYIFRVCRRYSRALRVISKETKRYSTQWILIG